MKYELLPVDFYIKNRKKITSKLSGKNLALLSSAYQMPRNGDQYYPFRQDSDFFYLTGIDQENAKLILAPEHPDKKMREILFVMPTSEKTKVYEGEKITLSQAKDISGIQTVYTTDQFKPILRKLLLDHEGIYLNLPEKKGFRPEVLFPSETLANEIKDNYPGHHMHRLAPILKSLRLLKEKVEIERMQHACDITEKAFRRILQFVKPGITEYQVEAEMTHEFLWNRATGHAYPPIIASGRDACVLHYIKNNKECEDGGLLLMDFGAEFANYAADVTRTIPVNGRFSERQKQCYEAVLKVQKECIGMLKPGKSIKEINNWVDKKLEDVHLQLGLYTKKDLEKQDPKKPLRKKYSPHGTCHFIGLDVHDVGDLTSPLEEGMVLTCEPGIYIEKEGFGIRIEDNIVVSQKPQNLTSNIPKEADEIEQLMIEKIVGTQE